MFDDLSSFLSVNVVRSVPKILMFNSQRRGFVLSVVTAHNLFSISISSANQKKFRNSEKKQPLMTSWKRIFVALAHVLISNLKHPVVYSVN